MAVRCCTNFTCFIIILYFSALTRLKKQLIIQGFLIAILLLLLIGFAGVATFNDVFVISV